MNDPESAERQDRIRDLFDRAAALSDDKRDSFLAEACGGDAELHREVSSLLQETGVADSRLEGLINEMLWPALESIGSNPSNLENWLDDGPESEGVETDPLIGTTVSHFEIVAPIGSGGMGMVYEARDINLGRTVALKFLPPAMSSDKAAKERFIHEAQAASGLDHPNIAAVHEVGETDNHQLFIAMGFYPGETFTEVIDRGPVPVETVIEVALQMAAALEVVHRNGIVHRDIKPGNLMVAEDGSVKLLDFGLAKLSYATGHTQVGQMIGTVAYMSPEQAKAEPVDHRTDIWSLGVVLYEALSGKRPFDQGDVQSTIHAILDADPEPPKARDGEIPGPLKDVLGRCLAKDPERRYQDTGDLRADLERAQEGLSPLRHRGRSTWKGHQRRRNRVIGGLVVGSLLLVAFLMQRTPVRQPYSFVPITEGALVEDIGQFVMGGWADFDEDGFADVAVANGIEDAPINLYRNLGDFTFAKVTEGIVATDPCAVMSVAWADQDNDGDLDLFGSSERKVDVFYRNDGDGSFTKVTEGEWVTVNRMANVPVWGDYDNDGWVDLYVANFGTPEHQANFLYHNEGDGTMRPVVNAANEMIGASHGCMFTDYDNDGDVDLFVTGQDPVQFRNEGNGEFVGVTSGEGGIPQVTDDADAGFSSADFDNDGDLDVAYTTWKTDPSTLLYRNEGGSRFVDVTHLLPSAGSIRAMGAIWGDYDNDGHIDLLITNRLGKNILYHNEGGGKFLRVTESPVVAEGRATAGATWVDVDNDGDLDLFTANGYYETFGQSCELFRNEGGPNHWISLNLVGARSNRSAFGAKVRALAKIDGRTFTQTREVQGYGSSISDFRVHFGLGDAEVIEVLRIEWPSGIVQELHDVSADQFLSITEETSQPEAGG